MSQTLREQFAQAWAERSTTSSDDETATEATEQVGTELAEQSEGKSLRETEAASDEIAEPEQGAEATTEEEPQRYTPASLAEAMDWTVDELYRWVEIPLTQQTSEYFGGAKSLSLGEIKDKLVAMDESLQQIGQMQRALHQQHQEFEQRSAQLFQGLQGPTEDLDRARAWKELIKLDFSRADWDEVRRSGKEVGEIKQNYAVALSQAKAEIQKAEEAQRQALAKMQQELAQWHYGQLMKEPEFQSWNTQEAFQQGMAALNDFAVRGIGFSPEELQSVVHHKAIRALWYAYHGWHALHAQQQAGDKLRKAPKPVMKPGGGQGGVRKVAQLDDIVKRGQRAGATQREKADAVRAALARKKMQQR